MTRNGFKYRDTRLTALVFTCYWLLSFFEGFISGAIGAVSKYYLILLIVYLLFSAKKLVVNWKQITILVWTVYYSISLLWSPHPEQGGLYVNSVISMCALLILFIGIPFTERFVQSNLKWVALSSFFLGVLGLFFSRPYLGHINSRMVLSLFGVQIDPNNMVGLYAYGVALGLYYIFNPRIGKHIRLYYGIGTLINTYDIFMTGSRSGIIVLVVLYAVVFFFRFEEETKTLRLFKRIVLIALAALAAYIVIRYMPRDALLRITGQDANLSFSDSTGRMERWQMGLKIWWETNPVFGCGWGAFECHGTFFTFLVDTGIIGIMLLGSTIASIAVDCIRKRKLDGMLVFVAGIIPSFFIGAQNKRLFWNALIVPIMILNTKKEK